jgi:voltage-gated potassium channel
LEALTERPLTLLALLLIPLILVPYLFELPDESERTLVAIDYLIWGIFAADLIAKVAVAPDRRRFLLTHWVDVLMVALPLLRPLRVARSMHGVRSLRVGVAGVAAIRALIGFRRIRAGKGVRYVLLSGLVVVVVAGCMVTVFERQDPEANIRSLPDGLWWAVTTVTTVGYGDTFPRTSAGRGVGIALMLTGIGLFGALTASLAALLLESSEDEVAAQLRELNERLRRLEERIGTDGDIVTAAREDGFVRKE